MLYAVIYTNGVKKFTGKAKESRNGESMSNLKGISEKCADVLKMHEPLVVLDDVVVTVDEEKEILYIVSKEDGVCKEFKLGNSGIEEKTDKEKTDEKQSNGMYGLFHRVTVTPMSSDYSWKNNICGYENKIYLFCRNSFSKEKIYVCDVKTYEKTYIDAMLGAVGCDSKRVVYPQCDEQYIVYVNGKSQLIYQDLNTEKTKYVRYEDGNIVTRCYSFKLLGTKIYFCANHAEYVYDILSSEIKLVYEFDKDSKLDTCLEDYCQQYREAVTEFFDGYQYTVAQNEKKDTVEFAKLNLSTGEMKIEELDMQASREEIGAWQLCKGHLYYTTLNEDAYLVDCDLTSGGYIENILEDKCPLVQDGYSKKFNVIGDWLYYKYGYKYHRISLKDGLHIVCR